jgi:hypothetical protein
LVRNFSGLKTGFRGIFIPNGKKLAFSPTFYGWKPWGRFGKIHKNRTREA